MADSIVRFRAFCYDAPSAKTNAASFTYLVQDGIPFFDYLSGLLPHWMQRLHETLGFQMRGLMSPDTQIVKWSCRTWNMSDPGEPVEGSFFEYVVPLENRPGVYNRPTLPPLGQNPKVNFTLRYGSRWDITPYGTGLKRARSIQLFAATDAFDYYPPLLYATTEASAIAQTLTEPFSLENIPVVEIPELTAYPVVCKFTYDDESLSADPDATNNDAVSAWKPVVACSYSLIPRYPKKNRFSQSM